MVRSLGFLGGGMMAEAIIRGVLRADIVPASSIYVTEIAPARIAALAASLPDIQVSDSPAPTFAAADTIILAVKPDALPKILPTLHEELSAGKLLVSIAAGVSLTALKHSIPDDVRDVTRLVRVMPNTPCLVSAAASALSPDTTATDDDIELVRTLFEAVGVVVTVPERLLDGVTGVSGSGPAYVFMMIEAMADAGVSEGLPRDVARKLAAQCVMGSAKLALESDEAGVHVAELRNRVESPGGTTIAATRVLEKGAFRGVVIDAVREAAAKSRDIGSASSGADKQ